MTERDDELSRRYRALARDEPPAALDAAILAKARQGASTPGQGASGAPRGMARWMGPVSIAAVLVLGIGVSLRMQLEEPGVETSAPTYSSKHPVPSAEPAPPQAMPAPAAPPAPARAERSAAQEAPPPAAGAAPQSAPQRAKRLGVTADSATSESRAIASVADPDPARELERIARLREAGRQGEADRALEEFRRRHPDFRIPEAMWERVKPR